MDELLLSWYQALQLLALGPCLFMVYFLCVAGRRFHQIVVPLLYFLSLSCSFLLPLRDLLKLGDTIHAVLLMGASAQPALSFLLIVQVMSGHLPPLGFWSILAVPIIGGSQIVYATLMTDGEVCIYDQFCTSPQIFRRLYDIFSISLVCLLTIAIYRRLAESAAESISLRIRQKRALVLSLVILNLMLLAIDLAQAAGYADVEHVRMAKSVVRIGFIYLVLTSVFRVFDPSVEIAYNRIPSIEPSAPSERDQKISARIREVFAQERLYRDMELDRARLARKLAVTEATLSRVVNQCFEENVSMLINRYRVEEAKARLTEETTPVTTIAFEVGFSSIPSFNRVFKQLSGMSPSEYRQDKGKTV